MALSMSADHGPAGEGATDALIGCLRNAHEASRRAARTALRHEELAATGTAVVPALHERMATLHRQVEQRHLVAVRLYSRLLAAQHWPHTDAAPACPGWSALMYATAQAAGSAGAVIALFDARRDEILALASDAVAERAHAMERRVGEGPSVDAVRTGRQVAVSGTEISRRWPGYGPGAAVLLVGSVVAVPVLAASACVGTLTLLNPAPAHEPAGLLGEALVRTMLSDAGPGAGPAVPGGDHRGAIYPAVGRISVRYGCSPDDALALVRARAFAGDIDLHAAADQVLNETR